MSISAIERFERPCLEALLDNLPAIDGQPDPLRIAHPLLKVLLLVARGTIHACDDRDAIAGWAEAHPDLLRRSRHTRRTGAGFNNLFALRQRSPARVPLCCPARETVMTTAAINPDMPVDEIMRRWPATIRVFLHRQMLCVGCPIGTFHTLAEACAEHGVNEEVFSRELLTAIGERRAAQPA